MFKKAKAPKKIQRITATISGAKKIINLII